MTIRRSRKLLFFTIVAFVFTLGTDDITAQGESVAQNVDKPLATDVLNSTRITTPPAARDFGALARANVTNTNFVRVGVDAGQPLSLTLDDAIRKALENNNSIELTRDDVRFQETEIRRVLGLYDPVFRISPSYLHNSSTGSAATNDFLVNSSFLHSIRPGGGDYEVFFNNARTENAFSQAQTTGGTATSLGNAAIYSSSYGVRFNQPLFRNFKIDQTRRALKIAKRRLEQTDADFRRQTIDIIAQVQRTYWDLVFALRDQQNRIANLDLTKENLRQVEARIEAGAAAPISRAEVATELANREGDVLAATQQVSVTENALKQLILRDATNAEWVSTYVPTDKPAFSVDSVNLDNAVKDAIDNRYEMRRLRLEKDVNLIDVAYFRNQTRPRIDFNATFSLEGLSRGTGITDPTTVPQFNGNDATLLERVNALSGFHGLPTITNPNVVIPGVPSYLVGGFNRSLANTFRSDAPNYSFGVTIEFPFRNRSAKAALAGSLVTQNQIETRLRQEEQVVMVEVRNSVQAVETARQRVLTARRARENAEELLKGERALFDSGRSTTFLLFQRENSLTNARNAEIRAETDYNKALADLQRATSTTFQMNNITVNTPTNDH
ncbi:MAG TPA: TolC family protein [Pyrinomonadaceae bacterium]|nr:TolC family protein [Pyrinomonadaceae bacterium]